MSKYFLEPAANAQLDDIYEYTAQYWSEDQAERYIGGLFEMFARIARREIVWRDIPPAFGVAGFYHRWRRHTIYWRVWDDDGIGIVAILHERMQQAERLRGVMDEAGSP